MSRALRVAAIDQGTTSTRAFVLDRQGCRLVASHRHEQFWPQPGWAEQDANEILSHIRAGLEAVGPVAALGIANQGESCLAWDARTGAPLSPVITWQDSRTVDRIEAMRRDGMEALTLARAGLPLDPYFSASKLSWLLAHDGAIQSARCAGRLRLGTMDAFLLDRLTGRFATDVTTASRTSLMNLATCEWDEELCALFAIPIEALPAIQPTRSDFGAVDGVPILASIVDQQASLYGHGCRRPGDMKITFGTGAFAMAIADAGPPAGMQGLLSTIAWQIGHTPTYALDGAVYDAGATVEWLRRLGLFSDFNELAGFGVETAIERDLVFVPALSGLGSPHWDRRGAGLWIGMTAATTARDLCQAALEGIALQTSELVTAIGHSLPVDEAISVDGGLSQNPYFIQILADALNRSVVTRSNVELTGLGAAGIAGLGMTEEPLAPAGVATIVRPARDGAHWRGKFAEAVRRSSGWRGESFTR